MIVTYLYSNNVEDQIRVQIRCRNFSDAINRTGSHKANLLDLNSFLQNTPESQKLCEEADLLVIHRFLFGPTIRALQYWKAHGKRVIVDIDQAINYFAEETPGYAFWSVGATSQDRFTHNKYGSSLFDATPLEEFKWGLGQVDAVTASTARLAGDWSHFASVHEIPDFINTDQYPILHQDNDNEILIGLGNNIEYATLRKSGLLSALENVCQKRQQVKLVLNDMNIGYERVLDIHPDQVRKYAPFYFEEWVSSLLNLDIGLYPGYGDFDLRMCPTNLLEFMISKIPWIASEQLAFYDLHKYGLFVQNSSNAWEVAILEMVDRINVFQKRAAGEPFLYALSNNVSANINNVLHFYEWVLDQAIR